jgi:hypothetical protein
LQLCEHIDLPGDLVFAHACKHSAERASCRSGLDRRPGPKKCTNWINVKNPAAPAVKREAEEMGAMKNSGWPHTLPNAIAAEIIPWPSRRIGVCYTFPGKDKQSKPIGAEDRATLERLELAGKLTYLDDDTRRRYDAMKRAGQVGR